MAKVKDCSICVRSKNAGPFWVTIEIFCDTEKDYTMLKNSPNITKAKIAQLYGVEEDKVKSFYLDNIKIIKFSYPRPYPSGYKYEDDMHSGQKYVILAEMEV